VTVNRVCGPWTVRSIKSRPLYLFNHPFNQVEEWERYQEEQEAYNANNTFSITADVEPYHGGARSHEPDLLMQKMMGEQPNSPPATSFGTTSVSVPKGSSNYAQKSVGAVTVIGHVGGKEAGGEEAQYDHAQLNRQRALEEGRRKYQQQQLSQEELKVLHEEQRSMNARQSEQQHRDYAANAPSPLLTYPRDDDDVSPMPSPPTRTNKLQRSAPQTPHDRAAGEAVGDEGAEGAPHGGPARSLNRITLADRGVPCAMLRFCACACACVAHACVR
jgi:hypothetical protein